MTPGRAVMPTAAGLVAAGMARRAERALRPVGGRSHGAVGSNTTNPIGS